MIKLISNVADIIESIYLGLDVNKYKSKIKQSIGKDAEKVGQSAAQLCSAALRSVRVDESMHVGDQITVRAKGQENRSKTPQKPLTLFMDFITCSFAGVSLTPKKGKKTKTSQKPVRNRW